jgi:hypothetical protein
MSAWSLLRRGEIRTAVVIVHGMGEQLARRVSTPS